MRRLAVLPLLLSLVLAATASATHQDPQRKLTSADSARARAMLVKRSDLPPGFQLQPRSATRPHTSCAAIDESDLTLTGEAFGNPFTRGLTFVESAAQVYRTTADAAASWRRATSAGGIRCLRAVVRREYAKQGLRLVSLRQVAFPRVAQRTVAYRLRVSGQTAQGSLTLYLDLVGLMHSRAHVTVVTGAALTAPSRPEQLRVLRRVGARMASAMRAG